MTTFVLATAAGCCRGRSGRGSVAQAAVFVGVASDRDGQSLPNVVMALKLRSAHLYSRLRQHRLR